MSVVDVAAFIGPYPFREVPHPDPDALLRVMDREGIEAAWVGHLPSVWYRDPSAGNRRLGAAVRPHGDRLRAAPVIRPDWPDWCPQLEQAVGDGVTAIRAYPAHWGMTGEDQRLVELAGACAAHRIPVLLTVRFEDQRQRQALDVAGDLPAATVRSLARAATGATFVVSGAGREFVEEVHWGLTPDERRLVYWDISWIWGPPEDHLAQLFRTVGSDRFVFGTMWPLRLAQVPRANLALLPDDLRGAVLADARQLTAPNEQRGV